TEPGSMLTTIYRPDAKAHVREAAIGAQLSTLLGTEATVQAWLVGGYHGTWLPLPDAAGITLDNASLRRFGASAGAGVLAALPSDRCGLAEAARVTRYLAAESAGQCGPCLNGLPRIAAGLAELAGRGHRRPTRADRGPRAGPRGPGPRRAPRRRRLPRAGVEADQERAARPFRLKNVVPGTGLDGYRGNRPQPARLEVLEGLDQFGPGVHDERPVGLDRLPDRLAAEQQDVHVALGPGRERDRLPGPEHGQLPHPDWALLCSRRLGAHGAGPRQHVGERVEVLPPRQPDLRARGHGRVHQRDRRVRDPGSRVSVELTRDHP